MHLASSRRQFLQASAGGLAGATSMAWSGTSPSFADDKKSPNEQPVVGFIGTGIRYHSALAKGATAFGPCAAVCDVDAIQAGRALQLARDQHKEHGHPLVIDVHEDYRRVLDRKDIDVVVIATPDHWHTKIAIDAMRAGKDVYCEKPLTLTIREGQQIQQVMDETERIVQVGTQQRTEFGHQFAKAVAMAHDNRVGKLQRVTCAIGGSRVCDPLPVVQAPQYLNWDLWLGQAPKTDYREGAVIHATGWGAGHPLSRAHRYYRWWYEYSGGKLTDWGAHHVDIAMWAMKKLHGKIGLITIDPQVAKHPVPLKDGMPTRDDQFNCATEFAVSVRFADDLELVVTHDASDDLGFENGIMFAGSDGRYFVNRGKLVGKPVEQLKETPLAEDALTKLYAGDVPASHMKNFIDCVKSRKQPISDVRTHNRMLAVCHGINIALRLGRKLTYDPAQERFVGDAQANRFVSRTQRQGFEITT